MAVVVEPSFALGELSDALSGRIDMEWYGKGLAKAVNFYILPSGGATLRPGTEFVGAVPEGEGKGRLVPFMFNGEETYCLLFCGGRCYVIQNGGFVTKEEGLYSFPFDIEEAETSNMHFAQSGDTLYVTHENHPPRKIMRHGHTDWRVEEPTFLPALAAPTGLQASTTASDNDGASVEYRYCVTACSKDGEESEKSAVVSLASKDLGLDNTTITLSWSAVDNAAEYKIYKDVGGTFGLVGYAEGTTWKDKNYEADLSSTPLTFENPFKGEGNYPSCVGFIQQRLVFAGSRRHPQKVWMSRSGNFENFGRSNPTRDDDAVYLSLYSRQVSWIRSLMSMRCLVVLTGGAEYTVTGQNTDSPLTPATCRASQQSAYGSDSLEPAAVGNSIIMLQRGGHVVRDMAYDYSVDGYQGNDLTIRSQHLLHGHTIVAWAYQTTPDGVLWCVRDDGILLTLTYNREHQVYAWTRHETDGIVEDLCCVNGDRRDEVYMIVCREAGGKSRRYVERLAEPFRDLHAGDASMAWYVDCGLRLMSSEAVSRISGLDHLEGRSVSVLADGGPLEGFVVHEGSITLPRAYHVVLVGLPYTGKLKSLRVNGGDEAGPSQGRRQKTGNIILRFDRSIGGEVGWERIGTDGCLQEERWVPIKYRTLQQGNVASVPFSGDRSLTMPSGWDNRGQFLLRQKDPLPLTLLCATLNVSLGER